ncbi:AzlD domain-containing protein [Duganella aceris]|jgi:branched-subunit amino acid transport protein|uniref:AzlD domain-containing protein n=1 Tax=Duganella aceris TaxID=2703883 RepID=A0ABX0FQN9_9BURK|nr:AzlD domain-containing protein [Duganella aceris]NGZ86788.1 AzlD domain-containing protein [Duganella aceris]
MTDWEVWVVIGVLALATAATRSSFWLIGHHITIPKRVQEMLRYAPACALAAIVAPDLILAADGRAVLDLSNLKLVSGIVATIYYLLRRNMLETIVFGMAFFTALRLMYVVQ